jgi:hypothetical protein
MARIESDKEDLIRDASALIERTQIQCEGFPELITIGFFADGRCSIYFDQDPFYQFDSQGRLRRAYEAGFLYRSQQTTLSRIDRRRDTNADGDIERVVLQRGDLTVSELSEFLSRMRAWIERLHKRIMANEFQVLRAVTPDGGIPSGTQELLSLVLKQDVDAIAPPAGPR